MYRKTQILLNWMVALPSAVWKSMHTKYSFTMLMSVICHWRNGLDGNELVSRTAIASVIFLFLLIKLKCQETSLNGTYHACTEYLEASDYKFGYFVNCVTIGLFQGAFYGAPVSAKDFLWLKTFSINCSWKDVFCTFLDCHFQSFNFGFLRSSCRNLLLFFQIL